MNYKKSLLSLAAVLALSNSVTADSTATYLPLTSETSDSSWVLFGVNGFSDGTPSALGSTSGAFSGGLTELEDTTTTDNLGVAGLLSGDSVGNMAELQYLATAGSITDLKVGVDMTGTVFDIPEPMRTIYIIVGSASVPNVKFTYKASLEGKGMEILLDSTLYNITITQSSTYSNPITASTGGLVASGTGTDREDIVDILDYNASNNPSNATHFDYTKHLDLAAAVGTAGAATASMYHFNAVNQQWEVWNIDSPSNGNDFTALSKGQAYWGRVDTNDSVGSLNNDGDGATSLVLGQATAVGGIPDPTVYVDDSNVSTLTTGWNMLAFDDAKPDIRHAPTGLLLSGVALTDTLVITDDSGLNSFTYDISANINAIDQTLATAINSEIETAKLQGTLPTSFNVKVFYRGAAGTLAIISDKKFSIAETDGTSTVVVTTLTGANPFVSGAVTAVPDLNLATSNTATSAYGEHALMLDLLTSDLYGSSTAASLDSIVGANGANYSAKVRFGDVNGDNTAIALTTAVATGDPDPSAADFNNSIFTDPIFSGTDGSGQSVAIDTDFDGTNDKVIVSSTIPFYVKDNTYVRVHTLDSSAAASNTITVDGDSSSAVTVATAATNAAISTLINAVADDGTTDTGVYANIGVSTNSIVTVSANSNLFDLKDVAHTSIDVLSATTDTNITTKGAIASAYSLDFVAALPVIQNEFTTAFTSAEQPDSTGDAWDINLTIDGNSTIGSVDFNATTASLVDSAAGRLAHFDSLVGEINRLIKTVSGAHAYATHDFDTTIDSFTGTKILISGVDIDAFTIVEKADAATAQTLAPSVPANTNSATAGTLGTGLTSGGDLSSDVKLNPIHTPDFAIQGPLYTLRNAGAGYDVRAMIKATTEMDATTGTIAWDSLDVTRDEDDWFVDNAFNLFKIDHNQGYWVYLEAASSDTVAIGTPSISSKPYSYNFKPTTPFTTTNVLTNGQLSVTITGLDDAAGTGNSNAGTAYAVISGEEIQLLRSSGTDVFTGTVSNYALSGFSESSAAINVDIRAVNGKGQAVESSSALSIDYTAPTNMAAVDSGTTSIALSANGNDTANFYIWKDYIPEVATTRSTVGTSSGNLIGGAIAATADAATVEMCSRFTFGDNTTLRIVAADGTLDNSNLSDAVQYVYATTLKGAHVLTHIQGGGTLKSQIGATYDSTCTANATQPSAATDNDGVSLATLTAATTSRLSFVPDSGGSNFTQDLAWTSNYDLAGSGTAVIQVQSTSAYAGNTFYVEYGGSLYSGTFPSTQLAADTSVASTPLVLTLVSAGNTSLN